MECGGYGAVSIYKRGARSAPGLARARRFADRVEEYFRSELE